jgi:hypothetical protein
MNEFILFSFPILKMVFISWCCLFINRLTIILFREVINSSPIDVNVQFSGRFLVSVLGLKIENRFLITFS